jgi:pyridoxamine 5'-phosphate oxidase
MLLPMTDPITEIAAERERAGAASDPLVDVCFLATADAGGQPSLRALSLRHVEPTGVGILISGHSPKAADLDATGRCELLILWKSIARQYRLRGRLEPMSDERRAEYWALKAHSSKLLEHYYEEVAPQSTPLADRPGFLGAIEALRSRSPPACARWCSSPSGWTCGTATPSASTSAGSTPAARGAGIGRCWCPNRRGA